MAFQTPITIHKAIQRIQEKEYVLPAIQREFVWPTDRIERLFDSLMRDYPIGSFLFWEVQSENLKKFKFYNFMLNYHEKDDPHCKETGVITRDKVTAVLDGQQRLTALNIALCGSYAYKRPHLWWSNPKAFPKRHLYLNLLQYARENERGMLYDFRFLTKKQLEKPDNSSYWYPVGNIFLEQSMPEFPEYLYNSLTSRSAEYNMAKEILFKLWKAVHAEPVIAFYQETSQNLDKVLDVFIRTNSGGMVLSRSDILMSIAVAHWTGDARSAINGSLKQINDPVVGAFGFSRDFLLKAGLMLTEIKSIAFRVRNFKIENIKLLNEQWDKITDSVYDAAELISGFGFSQSSLTSHYAILPIAYYLHKHCKYVSEKDAKKIREWLTRSLLKRGIWGGSGVDSLLVRLRAVIGEHGSNGFPVAEIEEAMSKLGKNLTFSQEELRDLAESKNYEFALLATLYPSVNIRGYQFHIDHIFPKSRFTWNRLKKDKVTEEDIPQFIDRAWRLPNYQPLTTQENEKKGAKLPAEWLSSMEPEEAAKFRDLHDLGEVPADIAEFNSFYEARRDVLLRKLEKILGAPMNGGKNKDSSVQ